MILAKRVLKSALIAGAYYTGLLHLYLRAKLRGRAVALTYHRVLPPQQLASSFSTDAIVVSPEAFRRHMQVLRKSFNPLTAEQFAAALASGQWPPRACIVTFDDGWLDNLEHALPILQECSVPAVLFVATDYIGTDKCFWQETLARYLDAAANVPEHSDALFTELRIPHVFKLPPAQRRPAIRGVIDALKSQPQAQLDELLQRVRALLQQCGVSVSEVHPDRFLSWPQVKQLSASGLVAIASHCCSHTPLTKLDASDVRAELQRSRQVIREQVGIETRDLAYPNGDHDANIAAAVRESGYRTAFTTIRGHIATAADAFTLRRINIHEQGTATTGAFLARVAGIF